MSNTQQSFIDRERGRSRLAFANVIFPYFRKNIVSYLGEFVAEWAVSSSSILKAMARTIKRF